MIDRAPDKVPMMDRGSRSEHRGRGPGSEKSFGIAGRRVAAVLVALVLLVVSGQAQTPEPIEADLGDTVDVRVVGVDVVVTDKDGNPVTGLTADDFVLSEDGRQVEIANFYVARRQSSPAAALEPIAAEHSGFDRLSTAPALDNSLTLVVYIDNLQLDQHRRNSYLDQVREVLDHSLDAGDTVMVLTQRNGVEVAATLTDDRETVEQAIAAVREQASDGIWQRTSRRRALGTVRQLLELYQQSDNPCEEARSQMLQTARIYQTEVGQRVLRSLVGLRQVTGSLAGVPGRKAILYLSNGLALRPGLDLFHQISEICPVLQLEMLREGETGGFVDEFHELTRQANSNRITFYTLDATGLEGFSAADASYEGPVVINGFRIDTRPSPLNDRVRRANNRSTLFTMANETGGRAMFDGNDLREDLSRITRDLTTYYALGFSPRRASDGREHRIRVDLVDPPKGHKVLYRRTHLDKSATTEIAERTLATLLFGFEDNPLDVRMEAGDPTIDARGRHVVPLRLSIALGELTLTPVAERYEGEIKVVISAQDEDHEPVTMRQQDIPVQVASDVFEAAQTSRHTVEVDVPVDEGETVLAVTVHDQRSQIASHLRYRVHVPSP